jgi:hypothetical protein
MGWGRSGVERVVYNGAEAVQDGAWVAEGRGLHIGHACT